MPISTSPCGEDGQSNAARILAISRVLAISHCATRATPNCSRPERRSRENRQRAAASRLRGQTSNGVTASGSERPSLGAANNESSCVALCCPLIPLLSLTALKPCWTRCKTRHRPAQTPTGMTACSPGHATLDPATQIICPNVSAAGGTACRSIAASQHAPIRSAWPSRSSLRNRPPRPVRHSSSGGTSLRGLGNRARFWSARRAALGWRSPASTR